jgi:hypothetical protein
VLMIGIVVAIAASLISVFLLAGRVIHGHAF